MPALGTWRCSRHGHTEVGHRGPPGGVPGSAGTVQGSLPGSSEDWQIRVAALWSLGWIEVVGDRVYPVALSSNGTKFTEQISCCGRFLETVRLPRGLGVSSACWCRPRRAHSCALLEDAPACLLVVEGGRDGALYVSPVSWADQREGFNKTELSHTSL